MIIIRWICYVLLTCFHLADGAHKREQILFIRPSTRLPLQLKHIFHHSRRPADSSNRLLDEQTVFLRADIPTASSSSSSSFYNIKTTENINHMKQVPQLDVETLLSLARMCSNAYVDDQTSPSQWIPVPPFHNNITIGDHTSDGLRGYVFGTSSNSVDGDEDIGNLMIIAIKGTSTTFFGLPTGYTSRRDKIEDNLMFSCCCGAVDQTWWPICNCHQPAKLLGSDDKVCDMQCMRAEGDHPDSYINIALKIYEQVKQMYPQSQVWFTGHSLGGAVSALAAVRVGVPAITFESPGEKMFFRKMQWAKKTQNAEDMIWHFGVSSDPIFTGSCQGVYSACYLNGYAMESQCHLGNVCTIDSSTTAPVSTTVNSNANMTNILHHRMQYVLDILMQAAAQEQQDHKTSTFNPTCTRQSAETCSDCQGWHFAG